MRKFTIPMAIVAGLIAPAALAADIAVKAPAPPPEPVWSWTGWYAGVNLGASFGRAKTDFNVAPATALGGASGNVNIPGFGFFPDTTSPDGFMGGGQIGYNWQWSPLIVLGLEADFQGALERDSANLNNVFIFAHLPISVGGTTTFTETTNTAYTTQIDWFGTVRGRIGYVWGNGAVMSYITGGLAYGEVKINGTNIVNSQSLGTFGFSTAQAFGHSEVNTGWVAGYGTEGRLALTNWTWKVEGLWMDLGTIDTTGVQVITPHGGLPGATGGQLTTHTRFTDGILRGGLNYKFY
jgi:outer membrane immunogenic protein